MKPVDIVLLLVIAVIVGAAIAYIVRAKKKGAKCIGCPAAGCCSARKADGDSEQSDCSCGCSSNQ